MNTTKSIPGLMVLSAANGLFLGGAAFLAVWSMAGIISAKSHPLLPIGMAIIGAILPILLSKKAPNVIEHEPPKEGLSPISANQGSSNGVVRPMWKALLIWLGILAITLPILWIWSK